jgi:hypothetical protein
VPRTTPQPDAQPLTIESAGDSPFCAGYFLRMQSAGNGPTSNVGTLIGSTVRQVWAMAYSAIFWLHSHWGLSVGADLTTQTQRKGVNRRPTWTPGDIVASHCAARSF